MSGLGWLAPTRAMSKKATIDLVGPAMLTWCAIAALAVACNSNRLVGDDESDGSTSASTTMGGMETGGTSSTGGDDADDTDDTDTVPPRDVPGSGTGDLDCTLDGSCQRIDLLFVIDNSGTMGEEQLNLARNFQYLVDELRGLTTADGQPLDPDVNIMVTTTDMGHPLCTAFEPPSYSPASGSPVYSNCNSRLQDFTGLSPENPQIIEEACTENCPGDLAPSEHFIHFDGAGSNVPGDAVGEALSCIGPQGINGCGFEAPLEAMLQAINEQACWNDPSQAHCDDDPEWAGSERGFLRDDAILGVVMVTDELDCSVQAPNGYSYFTEQENSVYWNVHPTIGEPRASSAICYNAGATCTDVDGDGLFEGGCESVDNDALQPVGRYTDYFDYLRDSGKDVVMLGILGVPEVVAHSPSPPFEPTEGGVHSLLYRGWIDSPYPAGDILPSEWDAGVRGADKVFAFGGLGPGCTGTDGTGEFTGQALPPIRVREVCEHLNFVDDAGEEVIRCCIESICDTDFSPAIRCLTSAISVSIDD